MNISQSIKTKTDLIKSIQKYWNANDRTKLSKRIMRQVKLQVKLHNSSYEKELKKTVFEEESKPLTGKKSGARKKIKIDWESLEKTLIGITEQWQKNKQN